MLLIECPWCGARAETEFSYGGEAGIVRPPDPDALSDAEWADYLFFRANPRGAHRELWEPRPGLPAVVRRGARYGHLPHGTQLYAGWSRERSGNRLRRRHCGRCHHLGWRHHLGRRRIGHGLQRREWWLTMPVVQPNRLQQGGRIDRARPLAFSFDGEVCEGFAGDTLASALIANGISLVGRSFKLRRPRGIVGSGAEEPNAIMQVGRGADAQPNLLATQVELHEGLVAGTTKGWPGVRFDVGAVNDLFGRMLGAGFYYKTFMYPRSWWKLYERLIRMSAGFGRAPAAADPDTYEHMNAHCDVLVAGGGPAGLTAALLAVRSGARVILADDQNEFGGSLLACTESIDGQPAAEWAASVVAELRGHADCTLLSRSTVFGYHDHNFLTIAERCTRDPGSTGDGAAARRRRVDGVRERRRRGDSVRERRRRVRERLWRVRARQVVLAQGSFERPLVFCNNDRAGVMLASAVSTYIHRYAVLPGRRAVVFTNNDSAYRAAIDLADAGAEVAAIVDSRPGGGGELGGRARDLGIPVLEGHVLTDVAGRRRVRGASIARWDGDCWDNVRSTIRIDCDLVAMSGGWSPAVHLHSQAGGAVGLGRFAALLRSVKGAADPSLGRRMQRQAIPRRLPGRWIPRRHGSRVEARSGARHH